jgi:hypothetical protein
MEAVQSSSISRKFETTAAKLSPVRSAWIPWLARTVIIMAVLVISIFLLPTLYIWFSRVPRGQEGRLQNIADTSNW